MESSEALIATIKVGRLRWNEYHKICVKDTQVVEDLGGRRWFQDVEAELQKMGIRLWRRKATDRDSWDLLLKELLQVL